LSHVYCPECGFQNPASANYCARCGTLLVKGEEPSDVTQTYSVEELSGEAAPLADVGVEGPALVVRSGGGRAGEHFLPAGPRTVIGRSPDCDIFLDDVTVSRRHAVLVDDGGRFSIEDQGSLNGTFVNRARIDKAALEDGDEVQIGKYRMTFFRG
jgi:pSer/pThr/pTyr-binding forkhead associated (FHA) protein